MPSRYSSQHSIDDAVALDARLAPLYDFLGVESNPIVIKALLQRLANEELAQAEYEDQVRAKVTAARADTRPGMTTEQLRQRLHGRYQELRDAV